MRQHSNRRLLQLMSLSVAGISLVLSGCSAPKGANSESAAKGSGGLTIACSQQEIFCQKISAAFEKASGIKTTYVRLGAGEVLARLQTSPGEFDVWSGGPSENHMIASERGQIENYVSPNAAKLPDKYNNKDGVWSGFYTDSIGFCSNKKELEARGVAVPKSFNDLLNPKLKGAVVMPHPATAGTGYMVLFTQQTLLGDQAKATDYFKKLHGNIMQYSKSAASSTEMAGRGEIAVGIALDSDCVKAHEEGMTDLVTSYPEEGTGFEVGAISILKNARNEKAAKQYMDWILTPEAQNLYASVPSFAAPTLPEAKLGKLVPPQDKVKQINWDLQKAVKDRDSLIKVFEKDISNSSEAK